MEEARRTAPDRRRPHAGGDRASHRSDASAACPPACTHPPQPEHQAAVDAGRADGRRDHRGRPAQAQRPKGRASGRDARLALGHEHSRHRGRGPVQRVHPQRQPAHRRGARGQCWEQGHPRTMSARRQTRKPRPLGSFSSFPDDDVQARRQGLMTWTRVTMTSSTRWWSKHSASPVGCGSPATAIRGRSRAREESRPRRACAARRQRPHEACGRHPMRAPAAKRSGWSRRAARPPSRGDHVRRSRTTTAGRPGQGSREAHRRWGPHGPGTGAVRRLLPRSRPAASSPWVRRRQRRPATATPGTPELAVGGTPAGHNRPRHGRGPLP